MMDAPRSIWCLALTLSPTLTLNYEDDDEDENEEQSIISKLTVHYGHSLSSTRKRTESLRT